MGNRQVVERYSRALAENDLEGQVAVLHDDYVGRYVQSGEVIRGVENYRKIIENYPGTSGDGLSPTMGRIIGANDEWVSQPSWPAWSIVHVSGSGDDFTITGTITYPSGELWHVVSLLTLLDGRIWRENEYFAAQFEPPEWRADFVELEEAPAGVAARGSSA